MYDIETNEYVETNEYLYISNKGKKEEKNGTDSSI